MDTTYHAPGAAMLALERPVARSERRARLAIGISVAAVAVALLASAAKPGLSGPGQSVTHAPFQVVDARGRELLSVRAEGVVAGVPLILRNGAGKEVVSLVARPRGGLLCVSDRTGEPIACLGPSDFPGWGPQLVFFSKPGIQALHLSGGREGGVVAVYDGREPHEAAGELTSRGGVGTLGLRGKDQKVFFEKP